MRIRGLFGIAVIALLSGSAGSAVAATPEAQPTKPAIDVQAIALDEIAAIDALGYPTEIATWDFQDDYTNSAGGTATTWQNDDGTSRVQVSTDPAAYEQFGPDVQASVRSTVRHELGHVWTFWLFPQGAEEPLSRICLSVSERSIESGYPANECAAEATSQILTEQLGDTRTAFYGLTLSDASIEGMRPIVDGALTWQIPGS